MKSNQNPQKTIASYSESLSLDDALAMVKPDQTKQIKDLRAYYKIGSALHKYRVQTDSDRVYGKQLRAEAPELMVLPSCLRSDCLWLFKFFSETPEGEKLRAFGMNNISELHSGHPTVLRRRYREVSGGKTKRQRCWRESSTNADGAGR